MPCLVHQEATFTIYPTLWASQGDAVLNLSLDADATSKQTSPEQYGTPLVHLLGAGILDGESLLQEDPVALSSLNNRIYPLSTGVPVTSVGTNQNSVVSVSAPM